MSDKTSDKIRIVFLGTPQFSVPSLQSLIDAPEIEVVAVVTPPDRPAGRGQKLTPPPTKTLAEQHGIPVHQTESIRKDADLQARLAVEKPDFFVTVAFGQILNQPVLDIPRLGTVNLHASLLPEFRGANPIQQAILTGKKVTGLTTMLTELGVDTGAMLLKKELTIGDDETMGELTRRLSDAGGDLLVSTLVQYAAGEIQAEAQDHEKSTHAPKTQKEDAMLDWREPAEILQRKIRAFNPAPGAATFWENERVKILKARVFEPAAGHSEEILKDAAPGRIAGIMEEAVLIATGDGLLAVTALQPAGKKEMTAPQWLQSIAQGRKPNLRELGGFSKEPTLPALP